MSCEYRIQWHSDTLYGEERPRVEIFDTDNLISMEYDNFKEIASKVIKEVENTIIERYRNS